jgi:hypothetical protein
MTVPTHLTISAPSINLSIPMLFRILHVLSILTGPNIFLSIFLSKMGKLFSSFALKVQVSAQYVTTGLIIVSHTGLFISPSGISDPCGTVAGMVTPKGSMSTEGVTLQLSVLPYRCSICAPLVTRQMSIL